MAKLKLKSKREYLSIAEVLEQYDGIVLEDIFDEASKGLLKIHVMADNWNVDHIDEINNSKEFTKLPSTSQRITVGNHTIYREFSPFALSGLQPISKRSIKNYRNGSASAKIEVDMHKVLKSSDDSKEYLFYPSPDVLIQDIPNEKLYVMKADLLRVFSNESPASDDAKSQDGAEKKKVKGQRPETEARYKEWQRRANEKIKKNPSLSIYAVAELIYKDLQEEESKHLRSVDAIRQHIKI